MNEQRIFLPGNPNQALAKAKREIKVFRQSVKDIPMVIIDLGSKVSWVGLNRNEALELARVLRENAKKMPMPI